MIAMQRRRSTARISGLVLCSCLCASCGQDNEPSTHQAGSMGAVTDAASDVGDSAEAVADGGTGRADSGAGGHDEVVNLPDAAQPSFEADAAAIPLGADASDTSGTSPRPPRPDPDPDPDPDREPCDPRFEEDISDETHAQNCADACTIREPLECAPEGDSCVQECVDQITLFPETEPLFKELQACFATTTIEDWECGSSVQLSDTNDCVDETEAYTDCALFLLLGE